MKTAQTHYMEGMKKARSGNKKETLRRLLAGIVSGLANGVFGAGGGMVAVPALERLARMEAKRAHASAICVILPLSAVTAVIYAVNSNVEWSVLPYVAPAFFAGGILGAKLMNRINALWLNRFFAGLMAVAAVWMLFG